MAIKGILFDKDGTLLDFNATWLPHVRHAAHEAAGGDAARTDRLMSALGYDPEILGFRPGSAVAAGTNREVVEVLYPKLEREALRQKVDEADRLAAEVAATGAVPLPGVVDALAKLYKAGYVLGVATNDSTSGAEQTLLALGVAQLFDATYGYDAVARPKPAPDMFLAFADTMGLKCSQIAMVGDNRHDLDCARAAGAGLSVAVLSGTGTDETLRPFADVVLPSVSDLPGYLGNRAEKCPA